MGRTMKWLLLLVLMTGCTKPKYIDVHHYYIRDNYNGVCFEAKLTTIHCKESVDGQCILSGYFNKCK